MMSPASFSWPASRHAVSKNTAEEIAAIRAKLNERPIVFPAHAVPGLLADRVSQVRRPVLPGLPSPLGDVGARLWVKEPWQSRFTMDGGSLKDLHLWQKTPRDCFYEAQDPNQPDFSGQTVTRWRDPIRMPRWASRILLEVVSVETMPLRSMKDADAIACGVKILDGPLGLRFEHAEYPDDYANACEYPENAFTSYWDQMHGAASWKQNLMVFVTHFKRLAP